MPAPCLPSHLATLVLYQIAERGTEGIPSENLVEQIREFWEPEAATGFYTVLRTLEARGLVDWEKELVPLKKKAKKRVGRRMWMRRYYATADGMDLMGTLLDIYHSLQPIAPAVEQPVRRRRRRRAEGLEHVASYH